MAHHRRNRPRKQPRSMMGSSHRLYGEPRVKEDETTEQSLPTKTKKKQRKRFGIENRYQREPRWWTQMPRWRKTVWWAWRSYRWYDTEKSRDEALQRFKKVSGRYTRPFEYRAVDR